ncbi:MAG: hypothetical protein JOZ43_02280, partial [Acidobacteriales bacterium]|nr:hypothetical protein [Terriglobales bacterium]
FIAKRGSGSTIIGGYPWFTDWGRDTMISLPGLTLLTGNHEIAREILLTFANSLSEGMVPNRFPDRGEAPEYNTVDATLWFIEAVRAYFDQTHDRPFLQQIYPQLLDSIHAHMRGTRYNIRMLDNGLLSSGAPGVQLTWMDAKVGDFVVTPRTGCPVEIQALWYNALQSIAQFAELLDDSPSSQHCKAVSGTLRSTLNDLFWNEATNCLYDVVDGDNRDGSIRPNQLLAISLQHSMLPLDRARAVLGVATRELLTPFGLRTLSPSDPNYHPHYEGAPAERDAAYHQGTVWPWLLGPYCSAFIRVNGDTPENRRHVRELLTQIETHVRDAGVGQVPEIFDGDPPHHPRGCPAQAWSVAEVLRILHQYAPS